jgi:hypothetical protein
MGFEDGHVVMLELMSGDNEWPRDKYLPDLVTDTIRFFPNLFFFVCSGLGPTELAPPLAPVWR